MSSRKDLTALFSAKLASSGLSVRDAKSLGYTIVEQPTKLQPHFYPVPAVQLPYYDTQGKSTGFYRIRYLNSTLKGVAAATKAKPRRYDQPSAELPQVYMPPIIGGKMKWKDILADPEIPLCITEGELKAACATKNNVPTMALGGVWNFKSKKNGLKRLPIFDSMALKNRKVFIIFDSDAAENPNVLLAQHRFAEELFNCGGQPLVVRLPVREDPKDKGIDDFIVNHGIAEYKRYISAEENIQEFAFTRELMRLNGEIALVINPVSILHYESNQLMNKTDASVMYANRRIIKQKMKKGKGEDAKEEITESEVSALDEWTKWEQRAEVWSLSYEPGQPKFAEIEGKRHFNTWDGWGCEPAKGDVSLWKWLLDQVFKNAKPEHRRWFEQWCAYPLQNPGVKMFSCPILFGQHKGTGKSLIGVSLMQIYGKNASEITSTQLEDERNVFAAEKQFVLGNEVVGSDRKGMAERLRNLITQHTVTINKKYQPDYVVRDTINYYFTSNNVDALYMDDEERRYFVHEVFGPKLAEVNQRKVDEYDEWIHRGEGASALFYHLLNVDLEGFNPTGAAPDTESKRVMVHASMTEMESWTHKLREDPDTCLRNGSAVIPFGLYRVKDLVDIYAPDSFKKPYEKTMTNALRKAGFKKAAAGNSCATKDGKINLWVIRETPALLKMSAKECGEFYDKERTFEKKPKFAKGGKNG